MALTRRLLLEPRRCTVYSKLPSRQERTSPSTLVTSLTRTLPLSSVLSAVRSFRSTGILSLIQCIRCFSSQCQPLTLTPSVRSDTIHRASPSPHLAMACHTQRCSLPPGGQARRKQAGRLEEASAVRRRGRGSTEQSTATSASVPRSSLDGDQLSTKTIQLAAAWDRPGRDRFERTTASWQAWTVGLMSEGCSRSNMPA
jgi:hypothetical protein